MNYIIGLVKILESPKYKRIGKNIYVAECRVQLSQIRQDNKILELIFWDKLAVDIMEYYQTNDYVIIEGYLFLQKKQISNLSKQNLKKVKIVISNVYPFLLTSNYFNQENLRT